MIIHLSRNETGTHLSFGKNCYYCISLFYDHKTLELVFTLSKRCYTISNHGVKVHLRDERLFNTVVYATPKNYKKKVLEESKSLEALEYQLDPFGFFSPEYYCLDV
jgi:hypothetical protein|tara:strand:+ start:389 stop:706 length:318 start_codon:yes stop_codon:yes gene_type:complete